MDRRGMTSMRQVKAALRLPLALGRLRGLTDAEAKAPLPHSLIAVTGHDAVRAVVDSGQDLSHSYHL